MAHIFIDNAVSAFIVHEAHDRVCKLIGWDPDAGTIAKDQEELVPLVGRGGTKVTIRPSAVIAVADED